MRPIIARTPYGIALFGLAAWYAFGHLACTPAEPSSRPQDSTTPTFDTSIIPTNPVLSNIEPTPWLSLTTPECTFLDIDGGGAETLDHGGHFWALAQREDGALIGWGDNDQGQLNLPLGTLHKEFVPIVISGLVDVIGFDAGGGWALALQSDGAVLGWGRNDWGQLARDPSGHELIAPIPLIGPATQVSAGLNHGAVLIPDDPMQPNNGGAIYMWGKNRHGELAQGHNIDLTITPHLAIGDHQWQSVLAVSEHTFAIDMDNHVWAWGSNDRGQLGLALDDPFVMTPTMRPETGSPVVQIAAGIAHTLAVLADGTLLVNGANKHGQLGIGTLHDNTSPIPLAVGNMVAAAAGLEHSIALDEFGRIWTWGANDHGQLGHGDTIERILPEWVPGLPRIVALDGAANATYVLDEFGRLWGWGYNCSAGIGNYTFNGDILSPTLIDPCTPRRPSLSVEGSCPGELTFQITDTAPPIETCNLGLPVEHSGVLTILSGIPGDSIYSVGYCEATLLELDTLERYVIAEHTSNAAGAGELTVTIEDAKQCGSLYQVMDHLTCLTSPATTAP